MNGADLSWIESWQSDSEDITDEEYFVYGEEQDSCMFRNRYLQSMLQISLVRTSDSMMAFSKDKPADVYQQILAGSHDRLMPAACSPLVVALTLQSLNRFIG